MHRNYMAAILLIACSGGTSDPDGGPDFSDVNVSDVTLPDVAHDADDRDVATDAPEAACTTLDGDRLVLPGDDNGVFDPSVASDPTTGRVWLSYSSVDGLGGEGKISTWLAYSDDGGATWCGATRVNLAEDVPPADRPEELRDFPAHWSHEVSAIVVDEGAPAAERWKLFWHRYLHVDDGDPSTNDRRFEHGWIALRSAATPEGLITAPERKLFSAVGYRRTPAIRNWNDSVGGEPEVDLSLLDSELEDCAGFTEPGGVSVSDELHLILNCGSPTGVRIASVALDHDAGWRFLATVLTPADAASLDPSFSGFSGGEGVRVGDRVLLLISPTSGRSYDGCVVYEMNDGTVTGPPTVVREDTPGTILSGVCTYDAGLTATGVLFGEAHSDTPQFRLFATGEHL